MKSVPFSVHRRRVLTRGIRLKETFINFSAELMHRRSILIAAPQKCDAICGEHSDISSWLSFLRSNCGGAWSREEIITAIDWNRDEILAALLSAKSADYSMVVYAGHGETIKTDMPWTETRMTLSSGELIMERELNTGSPRFALILDCRQRSVLQKDGAQARKETPSQKHSEDSSQYRVAYENAITEAEGGLIKVYGNGIGGAATACASFSQQLLWQAHEWVSKHRGVLSFQEGVALASEAMQQANAGQKAEYLGGRRLRHFPLAVSIGL